MRPRPRPGSPPTVRCPAWRAPPTTRSRWSGGSPRRPSATPCGTRTPTTLRVAGRTVERPAGQPRRHDDGVGFDPGDRRPAGSSACAACGPGARTAAAGSTCSRRPAPGTTVRMEVERDERRDDPGGARRRPRGAAAGPRRSCWPASRDIEVVGTGRRRAPRRSTWSADPPRRRPDGPADARRRRGRAPPGRSSARSWPTSLVLTSYSDAERIVGALDAGAMGYLLKDAEPEDVLAASAPSAGASRRSTRGPPASCSAPGVRGRRRRRT